MKSVLLNGLAIACCVFCGCDQSGGKPPSGKTPVVQGRATPASDQGRDPAASTVTEARLLDDLRSQNFDRVITTMNDVKGASYSDQLTPILIGLWNGSELHGLDKEFLSQPRIRIEIADVLAQKEKNGYQGLDQAAFAQYARGLIAANDTLVANQAMFVLGIAGSAADMSLLEGMAEDIAESRFRAAVLALVYNCNTTNELVEKLKGNVE